MFPVEQRYRPFEESRDYDLNNAIADAWTSCGGATSGGDILVFLPGEREIREGGGPPAQAPRTNPPATPRCCRCLPPVAGRAGPGV